MKIRGIEVRLDWTLLIIGGFVSFSLATGYFPNALPEWGASVYLGAALLSCIGLFASILIHELAHAIVAQNRGIKVESIILYLFGGVANLKDEARRPRDEFWIAVVGPLASLNLAGIFFLTSVFSGGVNPAVAAIANYLALINLMLGLFNLIPAYPLDGGRILRAGVWAATKDMVKATRWVAQSGQIFGWGIIFLGLTSLLLGDFLGGLWLALIGWFILSSAKLGYAQTVVSMSLKGLKVGQVMWQGGPVLTSNMSLNEAVQRFFQTERGRLVPVVEEGYLVGVVSPDEVRKYPPQNWNHLRVSDVMLRRGSLLAVRPEDDLQETLEKMQAKPAFFAAVIGEWGQFAGLVYVADIPRYLELQQRLGLLDQNGQRREISQEKPLAGAGAGDAGPIKTWEG